VAATPGLRTRRSSRPKDNVRNAPSSPLRTRLRFGLSLFWRTFFLLLLLLAGCMAAWLQTFHALEYEPRTIHTARQIASLVNLTRAALMYSNTITRASLLKTLADQEGVRILPRQPEDYFIPVSSSALDQRVTEELIARLGEGTTVATRVNDEPGLWIGFVIESDAYWLLIDPTRLGRLDQLTWLVWLVATMTLSLAGAALITRLINRPLKQLSRATMQVREGEYAAHRLDENVRTSEIRAVNVGFNRMADQLAKMEQDRAIMLAGISHDLRTPLARLRLETEMSVSDSDAREHMAADIEQLDAIINKFLDYARPDHVESKPVRLSDMIDVCAYAVQDHEDTKITVDVPPDLRVMADEVELQRVIANLIENARRYGKTPSTGIANIIIQARAQNDMVLIRLRDRGPGVAPELLSKINKPFFRGDVARTSAAGTGLGLAIVTKNIERMGGTFELTSAPGDGLVAHIRIPRAMPAKGETSPSKSRDKPKER
jgi:two-component system osmolarity sensor histidine kinase EnvZ